VQLANKFVKYAKAYKMLKKHKKKSLPILAA